MNRGNSGVQITVVGDMDKISKGVRMVSPSRDVFNDDVSGSSLNYDPAAVSPAGFSLNSNSTASANASNNKINLPSFGTTFVANGWGGSVRNDAYIDDTDVAHSASSTNTNADILYPDSAVALGIHTFELRGVNNVAHTPHMTGKGFQIVSPIHTSSHYQTFETPFLHELVGGDRNMEQTNLVVTPDGKTWDEVTRDVSYIGNVKLRAFTDTDTSWSNYAILDEWRGGKFFNKDFAIAYDRMICLVDGWYEIFIQTYSPSSSTTGVSVNGTDVSIAAQVVVTSGEQHLSAKINIELKRGDYVQLKGEFGHGSQPVYDIFQITRV